MQAQRQSGLSEVQVAVIKRLEEAIKANTKQLDQMNKRHSLGAVAWAVRNLLEIHVWTLFCISSEENANQFAQDSARDALELMSVPGTMSRSGLGFETERIRLIELARSHSFPEIERRHKAVRAAAQQVGQLDFVKENMVLSKFAHPTALSIMSPLSKEDTNAWKSVFVDGGREYASAALGYIKSFRAERATGSST